MSAVAPYGSWVSPITSALLVRQVVGLSHPVAAGGDLLWIESRPAEGGRCAIVRLTPGGEATDLTASGFSARTLVHEYGGLCHAAHGKDVFFSNFADQRIYRIRAGEEPLAITAPPPEPGSHRYADPVVTADGSWLICVREVHCGKEVINDIAALPLDGSRAPVAVSAGRDFYSAPRISPCGRRLAWLCWDHPNMPWDGTELWEAEIGEAIVAGPARLVAGGPGESISQPRYSPAGVLHFISDRSGWWNIYADDGAQGKVLDQKDAEFCGPDWVFGQSTYRFLADGTVVASWSEAGRARLGYLPPGGAGFLVIDQPFSALEGIHPWGSGIVAVAGSATRTPALVEISVPGGDVRILKSSRPDQAAAGYLSPPRAIEFPTGGGLTAHGLYYPPANNDFTGPPGELPPLLVMSHGGPTSAASSVLNLGIGFWTSRGIAVVDVNYAGSTGYGRAYRERLKGQWGVADVDDCANAALWLAQRGEVDGKRIAIRGGSAGGFTTLCALTFKDVFACGASLYGVADAGVLAQDTHKFESHYLDGLIGPWPQARSLYEQRSPILHTGRLRTPMILFQGLEDKVVPPAQAQMMAQALRDAGVPFAYISYPDEQHGFRKAQNITRTAEAELYFYGKMLGFEPADKLEPVAIENLHA